MIAPLCTDKKILNSNDSLSHMDHTGCGHSILLDTDLSCVVVPDLSLVHLVGEREAVAPLHLQSELLQALQERHHRSVELKEENSDGLRG